MGARYGPSLKDGIHGAYSNVGAARERICFAARCVEGASVGVSSDVSSCASIEGVVRRVECCRTVSVNAFVQLIIEIEEPGCCGHAMLGLPLAVRWRPSSEAGLRCVMGWSEEDSKRYEGRRLLVKGRLQSEERLDSCSHKLHSVPILQLPPTPSLDLTSLWFMDD
ncbi:hypothetical protein ERJ75_000967700 [Trypanosoma vivax]|nr:hypothetical protein ERJ75_000967700 [Trypanosoma vivax]